MVVHDFNFKRIGMHPAEADPPLVVDPNTVLTSPIAGERLQSVPWHHSQIGNGRRRMNVIELPLGHYSDTLEFPAELAPEDLLRFLVPERPDHTA